MRTAPGPQFIRLSKYNCTANLRSSPPFINLNLLVSRATPHSSYYCADPMGLLLQDNWIDPLAQDPWVCGTYKLLFWLFGETSHLFCFHGEWSCLYPFASRTYIYCMSMFLHFRNAAGKLCFISTVK